MPQPGDADPPADSRLPAPGPQRIDSADDLMAGNHRHSLLRQVALDDVQVGAANGATTHSQAKFALPGIGRGQVDQS
jgi:hypothetical protein